MASLRFCHRCDCQFGEEHDTCLHCGGALDEAPASPRDGGADPEGELVLLASLHALESRPLLDGLVDAGIPFAVLNDREARARMTGSGRQINLSGVNVFVPQDVHAHALELQQRMLRESLPDLPEDFVPDGGNPDACPACAAPLASDAHSCQDCGLEFPDA